MQKRLFVLSKKFVSCLCALIMCIAFIPVNSLSAFADDGQEGGIDEGTTFTYAIPFEPTDESSSETTVNVNFQVLTYDPDSKTGQLQVGKGGDGGDGDACNGKIAGKITIPSTIEYEGATLTVTAVGRFAFCGHSEITEITLPDTVTTLNYGSFRDCKLEKLVIPSAVNSWYKYIIGGNNSKTAYGIPYIEWKGNCSEIESDCDSAFAFGYAGAQRVNHIFWGDAGDETIASVSGKFQYGAIKSGTSAIISPGLQTQTTGRNASHYIWFPVTYYPSEADAQAGTNSLGTAYVSFNSGQTNSTTQTNANLKKATFFTYGDVANKKLTSEYFLNYNDGTHKTLTDYPAYPEGTDKWVIVGNPNPTSNIMKGMSCYPVKADANNIGQGYITGLEKSYAVTGSDIEPEITVYDVNGNELSADNYSIKYERKDGDNWTDVTETGKHGDFGKTYRMVISGKGTYTGSLTTNSYTTRGYAVGETITYKIKHTATDGTQDTVDCKFKVLTSPSTEIDGTVVPGTLQVGITPTESKITAATANDYLAIDTSITGDIEIPETVTVAGIDYTVTQVGANAFGKSAKGADAYTCKFSHCELPNTITYIGKGAFAFLPNFEQAIIPSSITEIQTNAYINTASSASTASSSKLDSFLFRGSVASYTSKINYSTTYYPTDLLFDSDSNFDETKEALTKSFGGGSTNWYRVDFYASKADADAGTNATPIYVKAGTCAADILSGNFEAKTALDKDAKAPSLPAGKSAWVMSDASEYAAGDAIKCGGKLSFYATDAGATDLSTARVSNFESEIWYDATAKTPSFTLTSLDGKAIDSLKYSISYEVKDGSSWNTTASCMDEGTYRIVVKAAAGSGYTGELKLAFKISRPAPGDKVTYPVDNVTAGGLAQKINMNFVVSSVGEGSEHGTVVVSHVQDNQLYNYEGIDRAVDVNTTGSVDIPQTIKLGNGIYDVTIIGAGAFRSITGLTGVTIPEGVVTIGYGAFDTTSLKQVVLPSTIKNIGSSAFARAWASDTKQTSGTIKEVVFKGTAKLKSSDSANASLNLSSIFANVSSSSGAFLFENEISERTITTSSYSPLKTNIYFKVTYYKDAGEANSEGESLGYAFVKKGATPATAASNLYSGAYCSNTIPDFPESADGDSWIYEGFDGSSKTDSSALNLCMNAYPQAAANSLANYKFTNSFKGISYPWTGSTITPEYGSVVSASGEVLDPSNYVVRYQKKNDQGKWEDVSGAVDEGTYRLNLVPAYGSGLVDQLYSKAYNIEKVIDPTTTRFNYPVKYVNKSTGEISLINCLFLATSSNEVKTSGVSTGDFNKVGVPGIELPTYDGDLYLPESMDLNGGTYTLTGLGTYSFCIGLSNLKCGIHIPSTVKKLDKILYSCVNYTNSNSLLGFTAIYYDGDCNITSMYAGSYDHSWINTSNGSSSTNEVIFGGKVSDYVTNLDRVDKFHFYRVNSNNANGKAYVKVRFYESEDAYNAGSDPIATVGIPYGTKVSDISLSASSLKVSSNLDKIPAFTGSNNYWCFAGVDNLNETITDGTLSCYQTVASATDLRTCVVSTDADSYVATGSPINPKLSVISIYDNKEVASSAYNVTYQRKVNGEWQATNDLASVGTLRVKISTADGSGYTGEAYSLPYEIYTVSNTQGEIFKAATDYLEKGTEYKAGIEPTSQVACSYEILKPASSTEDGLVMVSRGSYKNTSIYDYYESEPCVSTDLDGTLILPEKIKTDKGTFKVAAVANRTAETAYASDDGNNWIAFAQSNLTGIVIPASLDYKACAAAVSNWRYPTQNNFNFTGATKLQKIYFKGDCSDYTLSVYNGVGAEEVSKGASYIFESGHAKALTSESYDGGYLGIYDNVTFYPSKADAEAGTNALGSARVLHTTKLSELNADLNTKTETVKRDNISYTRYTVFQDGGAIPAFPESTNRWAVAGNISASAVLNNVTCDVYPVASSDTDLSQSTFYKAGEPENPSEKDSPLVYNDFETSKVYDGDEFDTSFALKDPSGNVISSDVYTVTVQRMNKQGQWEETKDFTSIGKLRIIATAVEGSGYTGLNSIDCEITIPETLKVPMLYIASDGTEISANVNLNVESIDEENYTITASIAPTAEGKAVDISSDYAGGELKLVDSKQNGNYDIKITSIKSGAFGDEAQDEAVEALGSVVIPAGIETIEAGAFQKTACDIVFEEGCKTVVKTDAFRESTLQAITYNGDAADVKIESGAFNRVNGDENNEIKVLFNAGADKSKSYGYATAIYPRETAIENLDAAYASAKAAIEAVKDLTSAEKAAALESLLEANSAATQAIEKAATFAELDVAAADAQTSLQAVAAKAKEQGEANAKAAEEAAKKAAEKKAAELAAKSKVGYSETAGSGAAKATYKITSATALTVQYVKTASAAKSVTVPATVKLSNGKTYKVTSIGAKAFGKKVKTVTVKTKNLTKKTIKKALKSSKVKTVKVKVGSKSANKKFVKKYKKIFTKANAGKKVTVK